MPDRADPDITARVFEQTEDHVGGEPVADRVDGFRRRTGELLRFGYFRKPADPSAGSYPPLARVIFQQSLVPSPSVSLFLIKFGELRANREEPLSFELIYESLFCARPAQHNQVSCSGLDQGAAPEKAIRRAEGCKPGTSDLSNDACRCQPQVPVAIIGRRELE